MIKANFINLEVVNKIERNVVGLLASLA